MESIVVVLGGVIGESEPLRLPLDVCRRSASFCHPTPWLRCHRCDASLMGIWSITPFVARLPTRWKCDAPEWVLTDRGNLLRSHEDEGCGADGGSELLLEERTAGSESTIVPERTPSTIVVVTEDGARHRFPNHYVELRQRRWYKSVNEHTLCRACFLSQRQQRFRFQTWMQQVYT